MLLPWIELPMRHAVSFRRECVMCNYIVFLHIITLDRASHETRHFLPPGVRHERAQHRISMVYVGSGSLNVNLVGSLCRLTAAVDQTAPPHDLRRKVWEGVNLLVA